MELQGNLVFSCVSITSDTHPWEQKVHKFSKAEEKDMGGSFLYFLVAV
jgi:hypothetical protein